MTNDQIPDPDERAARNTALRATGTDSGFWDERGRPTPWPDDIDEWRPVSPAQPITLKPGEQPL
jgi:hypothetical protein